MTPKNIRASFCLFSYNQEEYILEALEGALCQTFGEMEIIISDDCSTDNTFNLIQSRINDYFGPHKIIINRNENNLGLVPHINKVVFELATSDLLVFAAGDDISKPNRVERTIELFDENIDIMQVTSSKIVINEQGNRIHSYKLKSETKIYSIKDLITAKSFMIGGGASAYRRKVFTFFGPLNNDCPTEDSTLRNRSLLLGKLYESDDVWYYYRVHNNNISSPDNIFNLRPEKIADQYKYDIGKAKESGIISERNYSQLLRKIFYYLKIQKLRESFQKYKSPLVKRFVWLKLKWLYLFYRITLILE